MGTIYRAPGNELVPCDRPDRHVDLTTRIMSDADVAAWQERIWQKHQDEAARRTPVTPQKTTPAPARVVKKPATPVAPVARKPRAPRVARPTIRPCVVCGRMTRPRGVTPVQAPETISRAGGDMCRTCYKTRNAADPDQARAPKTFIGATDPAMIATIVDLAQGGLGHAEIGKRVGRSPWTITRIVKAHT